MERVGFEPTSAEGRMSKARVLALDCPSGLEGSSSSLSQAVNIALAFRLSICAVFHGGAIRP